jgi:outer membrane biosynthesis protein TonB
MVAKNLILKQFLGIIGTPMKQRIPDSIIGFCVLILLVLIPVYFLGLPSQRPLVNACVATACTNILIEDTKETVYKQAEPTQLDLSPTIIAQVPEETSNEPTPSEIPQPDTNPQPSPTTPEESPSEPSRPSDEEIPNQPTNNQQEEENNTDQTVVDQTLQPVKTIVANVQALLH